VEVQVLEVQELEDLVMVDQLEVEMAMEQVLEVLVLVEQEAVLVEQVVVQVD